MPDYDEQIRTLEEEISSTKYNKRTQHHIGLVKAKIAKLKEKQSSRSGTGAAEGFAVRKSGNATVALLGFPSVGKSTLLNALTDAQSKTGAYAFTTLTVVPGMMTYKGAQIQILDLPGIVQGASRGVGRGKEVISVLRQADLILLVLDPGNARVQRDILLKEIYDAGVRINARAPDVKLTKDSKGGITIYKTVHLEMDDRTIQDVLREFRISNATIIIRSKISIDELIDVIEGNKVYTDCVVAINKMDMVSEDELASAMADIRADIAISASRDTNVSVLKERIFSTLRFYRIYLKEVGKRADMDEPLIIRGPCSVEDVCAKLHRDFVVKFRFAKVWGSSGKFPGQKVSLSHELHDSDVLEIHMR